MISVFSPDSQPGNVKGNYEWPVTLPPKLLRDGFQIQPTETSQAAPIVTTEYTTFTYFATRKVGDRTITETDIVVSSNVVTSSGGVEPTPSLPAWKLEQVFNGVMLTMTIRLYPDLIQSRTICF